MFTLLSVMTNAFKYKVFPPNYRSISVTTLNGMLRPSNSGGNSENISTGTGTGTTVDVSDLNLTMDDLSREIPVDAETMGTSSRGYYTWKENIKSMEMRFCHPGTAGQPEQAIRVDFSDTTVSVAIFNYIVWTGILVSPIIPSQCSYTVSAGKTNRVPVIEMVLVKQYEERWNEVISEVAPNGLLQ